MKPIMDRNNPGIEVNTRLQGYAVKRIAYLREFDSTYYELEHEDTGARHIHISNDDRENTFGVAFKTVPRDSTGVAHILEHTVLCGSEKYPVRDPFFSMLKRSLSTFMNAFTASDWTMYPFSTQSGKDFYNLLDVYLNAVFHPNLDELSFKQEGHRLEIDTGDGDSSTARLLYKGVVYNEMKGAMSSPDQVLARSLLQALFPSTTYRFNSGGEPKDIPGLTHQQLRDFHQRHYHPSNGYFYTYGNLALEEHLRFIDQHYLGRFHRIHPDTDVPSQSRWQEPHQVTVSYPLAEGENVSKKSQVCIAWLMSDIRDTFEVLALTLLEQILMGNPASPLRRALIESGLGSALCDAAGYDADNRDTFFVCGLKGVDPSDAPEIERIVFEVLRQLVRDGIEKELIDSAIHQIEFHRKEVTNTPYPYGIRQLLTITGTWIHAGDPLKILLIDEDLKRIRQELSTGPFFENLIQSYFIDNSHRVLFSLVPDLEMEKVETERVAAELAALKDRLSPAALEKITTDTEALEQLQNTEENISCLPTLKRTDIPVDVVRLKEADKREPPPVYTYAQRTSGIFYLVAAAGAGGVAEEFLPLLPFFCYALPKIGTFHQDYGAMARRIDLYTGGVALAPNARDGFGDSADAVSFVSLNVKALNRNMDPLFEIVRDLFLGMDFSDLSRLKHLLMEYRANLESMVIHNGHRLAISRAARNFSVSRHLSETWSGLAQLQTVKKLGDHISDDTAESISEKLSRIRDAVFGKNNLRAALIGEKEVLDAACRSSAELFNRLNDLSSTFHPPLVQTDARLPREGWSTSSAVSFVAQVFNTVRMGHEDAAALAVISKLLRSRYLHSEIREKGGAYGGFSLYNPEDGLFCFASYRDPHIVATLSVFGNVAQFLQTGKIDDQDIDEAVLQVCSDIDKPDPPGPAAKKAFFRKLISLSDDARQHFKDRLLQLNRHQVMQAAENYFNGGQDRHAVAVVSGEMQLQNANRQLEKPLELNKI